MPDLSLLQSAYRVFHGGLQSYDYDTEDASRHDDLDDEADDVDNDSTDMDDVEPSVNSDSRAFRRTRAFAEFEARTFFYNAASRGRDPGQAHEGPASQLRRCLERQFGTELLSTIDNVVTTGRPLHFDPNLRDLSETVEALTNINTSMECESEALLNENDNIIVSQANNGDSDPAIDYSDETRQSLIDLYNHLERRTSGCSHEIMLQTERFGRIKSSDGATHPSFKLLLSPCPVQKSPQWQETCCIVERSVESLSGEEEDDEHDICSMLNTYQYYRYVLQIAFDCQSFRYQHTEKHLSFPSANTHVTLRYLLEKRVFSTTNADNTKSYSPCDRYLLGLNLAESLFYLFDGPWKSTIWNTDEIFFLVTKDSTLMTVHSRHRPYIRCSLSIEDGKECQTKRKTKAEHLCYPMWLALAQILVELHLGRNLLTGGVEALGNVALRQRLLQITESEFRDTEYDMYKEAIEACLNFGFKLLRTPPRARGKEERKLIRNDVISKLEKNYKRWTSALPECPDLSLTLDMQSQKTEEVAPSPLGKITAAVPSLPTSPARQTSPTYILQKSIRCSGPRLLPGVSILRLFDDSDSNDERHNMSSHKFFDKVHMFNKQYIEPLKAVQKSNKLLTKIKIAVLDSGVDAKNDSMIRGALSKKRIRGRWSPTGTDRSDIQDTYGHGTHVTRLLLKTAPLAEIQVAKISEERNLDETKVQDIVDAIEWAVNTVDADIITMSFGMRKEVNEVTKAIYSAVDRGKLVFAAAANDGGLQPRAYPACLPGVICIHATDGYGTPATFNPNAEAGDNFSTVGVGIQSDWASEPVFKSGTSFATPVAAGITASILDFVRTHLTRELDKPEYLYSFPGMRNLLRSMAPLRGEYHFISPWNVFRELDEHDTADRQTDLDKVCEELRDFITKSFVPEHWGGKHI